MARTERPLRTISGEQGIQPRRPSRPPLLIAWSWIGLAFAPASLIAAPPETDAVQDRLNQTVVSLSLDGVMFSKVIDQFRTEHNLNIYVNERALAAAGVGRDTRITVRLQEVPLATALELILRDAGGGETPLTYVVENDVVVVSTGEETSERPVTRLYDVTDLIDSGYAGRRLLNTPLLALKLTGAEGQGSDSAGGGSASQNPFQGGSGAGRTFERLETLLELIRDTVHPDGWREHGGKTNTINRQGNRLIVSAGLQVHQEIEALIALLRSESPQTVDLRWTLLRVPNKNFEALQARAGADWPRMSTEAALGVEREFAGEGATLLQATTTGPSGRGQLISSLRQQGYVAAVQPVVDESAVAYQPWILQANTGIELIVLPLVAHDGRSLTLDVSLAVAAPDEIKDQHCISTATTRYSESHSYDVAVQLRTAALQTVVTSVRLEIGQAIALAIPDAAGPLTRSPGDQMLLLLAPAVK